jgi:hypothetical protein
MSEQQPWWNDKDKVGGLAATIFLLTVMLCIMLLVLGIFGRIAIWLLS